MIVLQIIVTRVLSTYLRKDISEVLFIGIFCGLPFLLTTSILDIWLKEEGVSNTVIGLFTLLHCPYTLKFLWGPLLEKIPIPYLSIKLGQRKSWAVLSQLCLIICLFGIAYSTPNNLEHLMTFVFLCALANGCQDMTLYSFLLKNPKTEDLGLIATMMNFGFKIGMFISKSSVLYIAHYISWSIAYLTITSSLLFGIIFVLLTKEPEYDKSSDDKKIKRMTSFLRNALKKDGFISKIKVIFFECLICPAKLFLRGKYWKLYMLIIMLYKVGDTMIIKMAKIFYMEVGFSTLDIANAVQVFGTLSSFIGGIVGGFLIKNNNLKKCMLYAAIVHSLVGLSLICLNYTGKNYIALYSIVFAEVSTGGVMSSCFLAFIYSLCRTGSRSTQFAVLWSFHEAFGILFRTVSGWYSDIVGWSAFFVTSSLLFIPGIIFLLFLIKSESSNEIQNS